MLDHAATRVDPSRRARHSGRISDDAGEVLRVLATQRACRWDADLGPIAPRGSPTADAVEALGVAAAAAVRRFGQPMPTAWQVISGITGTLLLSPTALPFR